MAKRPTSGKSAPSGPSAASAIGGGSTRDRNRGPAQSDSSRRAAAITEDTDEGGGVGAGHSDEARTQPEGETGTEQFDPHAKQSKAQDYVVLEGGTIDDGKVGSKFKICKAGDVVQLTPERAAHFQKHGVPLVDKKVHDERKKREEQAARQAAE